MSTKNIRAVLEWAGRGDAPEELRDALAEAEAIEKAARHLAHADLRAPSDSTAAWATIDAIAKESEGRKP